jgi:class 3 adenylate cyclase
MDPKQTTTQITQLLIRRRRSAILAADVAGYSALMGADEERTLKRLDAARSIMDARIVQHGGRIANTAGDSVIAEFPKAVAAVLCAVEVQTALRQRNAGLPPPERLQFRIGINYGEVMANRADLLGDNVNVAARIENLAEPGGVLISESAHEQVYGRVDVDFRPLGEQILKNINRRVVVYEVMLPGAGGASANEPAAARSTATAQSGTAPRASTSRSGTSRSGTAGSGARSETARSGSARVGRAEPRAAEGRSAWPLVAALGFVVLLAIGAIAYLVMTQLLPARPRAPAAGTSSAAAPAPTAAPTATAAPDLARLTADANAALAGFACARLRAAVAAPAAIAVSGYVGADADAKAAVARLAAVPGAGPVTPRITVMPPPLCQVLDAVPAPAVLAANAAAGPGLAVGGADGVYRDGDSLLVSVTAPSAYDGYLYVDYIDGQEKFVAHLLPNDLRPDNHVIAGQQIVIGKMPQEIARYGFQPPYGTNLIIVLSTRRPLFDAPVSKWSELAQFLPKFAQALQAQPDALVAYATVVGAPK